MSPKEPDVTRILDLPPASLARLGGDELVSSIREAEGRTVAAETIVASGPLLDKVSNPEIAAAFGADVLVLNVYDVEHPRIVGMPATEGAARDAADEWADSLPFGAVRLGAGRTAGDVARWTGRVTAVNLEPVPDSLAGFPRGRRATVSNAELLIEQGAAIAVITGNPGTGVTMEAIARAVRRIREATAGRLVVLAGRMHAAGSGEEVVSLDDVARLADAGAHGLVMPAPGTTPGASMAAAAARVEAAHGRGLLVWSSIGTSQEGASESVVERIGLDSKACGADIHHIGDSGYFGIAPPENIYAYSVAIRGRRHTWHRMAASMRR